MASLRESAEAASKKFCEAVDAILDRGLDTSIIKYSPFTIRNKLAPREPAQPSNEESSDEPS